jgi:hydroxyethylthiazole kinase-like uncharacterized protein yjeF
MRLDAETLPSRLPQKELLTPDESARADTAAIRAGIPIATLMQAAGRAVARAVQGRYGPCRTLVLCGPGNNGGDGYVAARLLRQAGWPVMVAALSAPRDGTDAAAAAARWRGPIAPFGIAAVSRAELVIDAIFGAGLSRGVEGRVADALKAASRVLAVDIPSGVDGATGAVLGYAPTVDATITFFRGKPGHFLLPGRDLCGNLEISDIGLPPRVLQSINPPTALNLPVLWRLPEPTAASHKYSRGHVTVLGNAAMGGAARLAASAARRAGAGLVSIAAEEGADLFRTGEPGLLVTSAKLEALLEDPRRTIWVCGPGFGVAASRAALPVLVASGRTVVADADALTAFAGHPDSLRRVSVITPHAGEFARVFGDPGNDRLSAARAAAARTGAVVLLKGSDTIIAAPDGRAAINASAPPFLATAGAGDVLSGLIAGLLAQGMPPWDAACAGAWLHGRSAALLGPGLVADDLPMQVPAACLEARRLYASYNTAKTR